MLLRKSLALSAHNWKTMVLALLCQVLILAVLVALVVMIFGPLADDLLVAFRVLGIGDMFSDTVRAISDGTFDSKQFATDLQSKLESLQTSLKSLPKILNHVELTYLVIIGMILGYRMLISFSDVTVGFCFQEFMTSSSSRPFFWYLIKKQGETWRFISMQLLITLPLDVLIVLGSFGLFFVLAFLWGIWAVIPAGVVGILLYAIRQSWFGLWLPAMTVEEYHKAGKALKRSLSLVPYRFWSVLWKTLLAVIVMTGISAVSMLYISNGIVKLVVGFVPNLLIFFVLKSVNFVEYFEACNKPYFYKTVYVEGTVRSDKRAARLARRANKAK